MTGQEGPPDQSASQETRQESRPKILVIEDELPIRILAEASLASLNAEVTMIPRGEEIITENPDGDGHQVQGLDFDIVISDIDLSKAGGVLKGPEIIKIMASEYEKAGKLPPYFIGCSSQLHQDPTAEDSIRDEFIAAGADSTLAKPYLPKALVEKVRTGIATRQPQNRPAPPAK